MLLLSLLLLPRPARGCPRQASKQRGVPSSTKNSSFFLQKKEEEENRKFPEKSITKKRPEQRLQESMTKCPLEIQQKMLVIQIFRNEHMYKNIS